MSNQPAMRFTARQKGLNGSCGQPLSPMKLAKEIAEADSSADHSLS